MTKNHTLPQRGPNEALIGKPGSRAQLTTPALVLDLDRLEQNIETMATHCRKAGHAIRPVAKIHKSVDIARRQVAAGALGVCCATLREAEVMVEAGIPGVLLFSSVVTPAKIARLADLNTSADGLMVALDDAANADALAAAARAAGKPLKALVDLDVGGKRTGLASVDAACALAKRITETEGLEYAGIQGYSGKTQRIADFADRTAAQDDCIAPLRILADKLTAIGLAPGIVSGGGTGTQDIDPGQGLFTESQAGTYVFMDVNYLRTPLWQSEPSPYQTSLFVRASVISAAQPGFVITDAGMKEFAREEFPPEIATGAPAGATYDLVGDDLGRINFANPRDTLAIGDAVECITPHCYATLNLYDVFHCVRGDTLVDIWPVAPRINW